MAVDMLSFNKVLTSDQSVTGPEFMDVLVDGLPELKRSHFWWQHFKCHHLVSEQFQALTPFAFSFSL